MKNTEHQEPTVENTLNTEESQNTQTDKTTEQNIEDTDKTSDDAAVWQDKYMRLSAEFDNFRKRTLKEKIELLESGGEKVLRSFLEIADDLERALASLPEGAERQGIELIHKKFMDTFSAQKVTPIEAVGQPLNVDYHDAIANFPTDSPEKVGTIIDVVQTGYMMGERVLRHAKVVVGE